MAKSNAQRQREWRERQKRKRECTYGGCGNRVDPPHTLCADHLRQAREARQGSLRHLQGQVYDLQVENAELRGRLAEMEKRYAEASQYGRLQLEKDEWKRMCLELAGPLAQLCRQGVIDRAVLPPNLAALVSEIDRNSPAPTSTAAP